MIHRNKYIEMNVAVGNCSASANLDEICHLPKYYHLLLCRTATPRLIICIYRCYLRICRAGGRGESEGRTSDPIRCSQANRGGGKLSFPAKFPCLSFLLSLNRKEKFSCPAFFNFEDFFLNRPYRRHKKGD